MRTEKLRCPMETTDSGLIEKILFCRFILCMSQKMCIFAASFAWRYGCCLRKTNLSDVIQLSIITYLLTVMKKVVTLLLIWLCALGATAYDFEYGGLGYTILSQNTDGSKNVSVSAGATAPAGELNIPSGFTADDISYIVTRVAESGFRGAVITSVTLPSTVTKIDGYAFYYCSSLVSVTLGNAVDTIGNRAFCNDIRVKEITLPETIKFLDQYAFGNMPALESVTFLGSTLPKMSSAAFAFANKTPSFDVRKIYVPEGTFATFDVYKNYCGNYTSKYMIVDPKSDIIQFDDGTLCYRVIDESAATVKVIGPAGLLTSALVIPSTVENEEITYTVVRVEKVAFEGRSDVTAVAFPSTVTVIDSAAFRNCSSLETITLAEGIDTIGNRAFLGALQVTELTIPASVKRIENYAFGNLINCSSVTFESETRPSLHAGAFYWSLKEPTYELRTIHVPCGAYDEYSKSFDYNGKGYAYTIDDPCAAKEIIVDGYRFQALDDDATAVRLLSLVIDLSGVVALPDSIEYEGKTYTVKEIASYALSSRKQITELVIPKTITVIDTASFRDCTSLTKITIPEGIIKICNRAFCNDSLVTSLVLPSTLETIEDMAFGNFVWLDSLTVRSETPPGLSGTPFGTYLNTFHVQRITYVDCGLRSSYSKAWKIDSTYIYPIGWDTDIYHHNHPSAQTTEVDCTEAGAIAFHRVFTPNVYETLTLPFDVSRVVVVEDGEEYEIVPVNKGVADGNYWLREQSENKSDDTPVYGYASEIEKGKAYIVCFPDDYYLDKDIIFYGEGGQTLSDDFTQQSASNVQMYSNTTMKEQTVSDIYLLKGNFILHEGKQTLYPSECYLALATTMSVSRAPRSLAIRMAEDKTPTGNGAPVIDANALAYSVDGNTLTLLPAGSAVSVYTVAGTLLQAFPEGTETATIMLPSGCYIVRTNAVSQTIVL